MEGEEKFLRDECCYGTGTLLEINDMIPSKSNVIVTSTPICNHYDRTWSRGHCNGAIGLSQDSVRPSMYCTTHFGYIFHVIPLALLV